MVDGGGLENRCAEMYRGFESHSLPASLRSDAATAGKLSAFYVDVKNRGLKSIKMEL